jgi:hypothetical protein
MKRLSTGSTEVRNMPEAENVSKESQFVLGVVDLFAVLLPGAIIIFWILRLFRYDWLTDKPWEARNWVVLFVASYVAGHVISAIGSILLDRIYDRSYKLAASKATEKHARLRLRAKSVLKHKLDTCYDGKDNALEWAQSFIRLSSGPASAEIDRLEADSKFFRSLAAVLIAGWFAFCLSPDWSSAAWLRWCGAASVLPVLLLRIVQNESLSEVLERRKQQILGTLRHDPKLSGRTDSELEALAESRANAQVSRKDGYWAVVTWTAWALLVAVPPWSALHSYSPWLGAGWGNLGPVLPLSLHAKTPAAHEHDLLVPACNRQALEGPGVGSYLALRFRLRHNQHAQIKRKASSFV